jgi:pimeloyl-ACP methyl ester carboxylesterase
MQRKGAALKRDGRRHRPARRRHVALKVSPKLVRGAAGIIAVAGAASAAYQAIGSRRDRHRYRPPGRLVEVGGRRAHLWLAGDGVTTVVVVAALGSPGLEWAQIQRALVSDTAVVLYDRAGLGWSDPGPRPRSAGRIADELHQILEAAGVPAPYLLVGHSLGGLVVRLYGARHPDAVAGLVLVDPTPEDYQRRIGRLNWRSSIPGFWLRALQLQLQPLGLRRLASDLGLSRGPGRAAARGYPPDLQAAGLALALTSAHRRTVVQELLALARSATEARVQAATLGEVPVTVLSGGERGRPHWYPTWAAMQEELARRLSTPSHHVVAGHTGHHVHLDDPSLVVRVIRQQLTQLATQM